MRSCELEHLGHGRARGPTRWIGGRSDSAPSQCIGAPARGVVTAPSWLRSWLRGSESPRGPLSHRPTHATPAPIRVRAQVVPRRRRRKRRYPRGRTTRGDAAITLASPTRPTRAQPPPVSPLTSLLRAWSWTAVRASAHGFVRSFACLCWWPASVGYKELVGVFPLETGVTQAERALTYRTESSAYPRFVRSGQARLRGEVETSRGEADAPPSSRATAWCAVSRRSS